MNYSGHMMHPIPSWVVSALLPLAQLDVAHFHGKPDNYPLFASNDTILTLGDVRRARRILEEAGWPWQDTEG